MMKSSRAIPGAIVVGAVAVASMFAVAPASAATLPPGQKISVVDVFGDQFYNVSPTTAVATPVGAPTAVDTWVTAVDVDETAGVGYAIATYYEYEEPEEGEDLGERYASEGWLYKADANTGKLSDGKQVLIDDGGELLVYANECTAIDYSKGVITAVCYTWGEGEIGYVGTIDPSGEVAVLDTDTVLWEQDDSYHFFTAIAIDPLDGTIYGFETSKFNYVWTITLDGEDPVLFGEGDDYLFYDVFGADFDRGGQLWLSVEPPAIPAALNETYMTLATFDFDNVTVVPVSNYASEDPYEINRPEGITVWGVLAATGSTVTAAPAIAASGILLLGALLAAGTMVLRRRSVDAVG